MNATTLGIIAAAIFGSGGVGAMLSALISKRKTDADSLGVLSGVWHSELHRLEARVDSLEKDLAQERNRRRVLEALLVENRIPIPKEGEPK